MTAVALELSTPAAVSAETEYSARTSEETILGMEEMSDTGGGVNEEL